MLNLSDNPAGLCAASGEGDYSMPELLFFAVEYASLDVCKLIAKTYPPALFATRKSFEETLDVVTWVYYTANFGMAEEFQKINVDFVLKERQIHIVRMKKRYVLVALMRFKDAVHAYNGDEKEKVAAAKLLHPRPPVKVSSCFTCKAVPTKLSTCAACKTARFCNKKCQIDGWKKHKIACKQARKRKKLDYSQDKMLVGELLSI